MTSGDWLADSSLLERLRSGELAIEGRMVEASNATLRCVIRTDDRALTCVYKPVAGERPLWDFPERTLCHRELAAHALSEALGWHLVPPTAWRDDGPAGAGMCQLWIEEDQDSAQVGVVPRGQTPPGWLRVLEAEDGRGNPVELVHASTPALQRLAVFDAIANNADRKGGHVLTDADGRIWAIDHGVAFAVEDKLRTVLWGWSGEPVPTQILDEVESLHDLLDTSFDPIDRWLADDEREQLRARIRNLIHTAAFPVPSQRWPAVPWPVF